VDTSGTCKAIITTLLAAVLLAGCGRQVAPDSAPTQASPSTSPVLPADQVDTTGAVPWNDRVDYVPWTPPAPAPRDRAQPCSASDLRLHRVGSDGAMQSILWFVSVEKTTPGFCTLDGYPGLTGTNERQERTVIPTRDVEVVPPVGVTPSTIQPHELAQVTISFGNNCNEGQGEAPIAHDYTYAEVALVLSDGIELALGRDMKSSCAPTIGQFHWDDSPIEQPVRWEALQAEVTLPDTVAAGGTLLYVVTLRNSGEHAEDLTPCPGYRQSLTGNDMNGNPIWKGIHDEYRLSCEAEPVIPGGQSRSYVMELRLPPEAPPLPEAYLEWQLIDTSPDQRGQGYVAITR